MLALVEAARPEDLPAIAGLLRGVGLPVAGLTEHVQTALVVRKNGSVVGSAALELYGPAALLRSVAVARELQGEGLGRGLAHAALDLALRHGVNSVYLLTETAPDFFAGLGFLPIERKNVDAAVQASVEFTSACPASALVMVKDLDRRA